MKMTDRLRQLGKTDLYVSPVAMGCWPISGMTSLNVSTAESQKTLEAAVESGINFFDTAHCYGLDGASERLVGQLIRQNRDAFVVATKCGVHWDVKAQKVTDGSPNRLLSECEQSLKRMNTDRIDLMYLHEPDPNIPIEESATIFNVMIESGKVRHAALSNVDVDQAEAFHSVCPVVAVQPPFNLLQQQIKSDLVPWCKRHDVSIVSYWPLMKGLLAGRIRRDYKFQLGDKRSTYGVFQGDRFEAAQRILDRLDQLSETTGLTVAQLIIAWTISQPFLTAALCGAKRDWQIQETAVAMNADLPDEIIAEIGDLGSSGV